MPLPNGKVEKGKCAYKLIQYMACSKPVVASPVGENKYVVEHGVNGFLASNRQQWSDYLLNLVNDVNLRNFLGANGRKKVLENYTVEGNVIKLVNAFTEKESNHKHSLTSRGSHDGRFWPP